MEFCRKEYDRNHFLEYLVEIENVRFRPGISDGQTLNVFSTWKLIRIAHNSTPPRPKDNSRSAAFGERALLQSVCMFRHAVNPPTIGLKPLGLAT